MSRAVGIIQARLISDICAAGRKGGRRNGRAGSAQCGRVGGQVAQRAQRRGESEGDEASRDEEEGEGRESRVLNSTTEPGRLARRTLEKRCVKQEALH